MKLHVSLTGRDIKHSLFFFQVYFGGRKIYQYGNMQGDSVMRLFYANKTTFEKSLASLYKNLGVSFWLHFVQETSQYERLLLELMVKHVSSWLYILAQ